MMCFLIFYVKFELFKIFIFFFVGFTVVLLLGVIVFILNPHYKKVNKNSSYECGCDALTGGFSPIDVDFFVLAILFIIFDVEFLFIFIFSISFKDFYLDSTAILDYWAFACFYLLVMLSLIYEILRKSVDFFNEEKLI